VLLCRYSEAFIALPGGVGTLDELFEIITLIQTGKMKNRPLILVHREFWEGLLKWMREVLIPDGMIHQSDYDRLVVVDTAEEVAQILFKAERK
jgi:uncharacterized protein (TIGR00730 family)